MTDSSTSTDRDRASPGTVVGGRYELHAAVGHGGMGAVWRATDTQLGREVAVKEVAPPQGISREERDGMYERMLREARAAAALSHPSVVQVYDVVTDGGRPWVVMELLGARSLADLVLSDGPLAPRAVAKIGIALLGALEVAHAARVLHRDVKPANVLVCTDGRCVLTDFGVARLPTDAGLTTPGMVLGSPHFISPERALGGEFGPPSDLFSLGVTLFTAVEGRPPFDKGDPIATMHSVVEDQPAVPERAGPLAEVLTGLLEKDPQRRWDVPRARDRLRELLAGPLASASRMHPTDPMAVVPPQREPEPPAHQPGSRIGGRALLPPGDTSEGWPQDAYTAVPDQYGQLADAYRSTPGSYGVDTYADPPAHRGAYDTGAYAAQGTYGDTGAYAGQGTYGSGSTNEGDHGWHAEYGGAEVYARTGASQDPHAQPVPRQWRRSEGTPSPRSGWSRQAAAQVAVAAGRAASTARQLPRGAQVAALAGVAVVLLAGGVWLATSAGDDDPQGATPGANESAAPATSGPEREPALPVQRFAERGIEVNIPSGWEERDRTDIRVDFADPDDPDVRLRLLQEASGADAMGFIDIIEPLISCPEPYQRVDLSEIELAGEPAALLEYVCGEGDDTRHSLWTTVVRDGTAYSFFLSVPENQFAERKPVFDEMLASFAFSE